MKMVGKKSTNNEQCPIEFCWGAFCKQLLQEPGTSDFSLINVVLHLKSLVHKSKRVQLPQLGIGSIFVYSAFRRKPGADGAFVVDLNADIDFPGQRSDGTARLEFAEDHKFGQLGMKFMNPILPSGLKPGNHEFEARIIFKFGYNEIGRVVMPITIEVIEVDE